MLEELQLKDPFQETPYRFSVQGLATLTGVFFLFLSVPFLSVPRNDLKACCCNLIGSLVSCSSYKSYRIVFYGT
jgi:hypothetical protein